MIKNLINKVNKDLNKDIVTGIKCHQELYYGNKYDHLRENYCAEFQLSDGKFCYMFKGARYRDIVEFDKVFVFNERQDITEPIYDNNESHEIIELFDTALENSGYLEELCEEYYNIAFLHFEFSNFELEIDILEVSEKDIEKAKEFVKKLEYALKHKLKS